MKKQEILVRNFYGVSNQVFNVGENKDSKQHFDPIHKRYYIYASANNVKHCIREEYESKLGLKGLETFFEKAITVEGGILKKDGNQGGVGVNINMDDYKSFIMGLWCSLAIGDKDVKKYESIAIKSAMNIGEFKPVHTLLSSIKQDCGVNSGNNNSKVCFSYKENKGDKKYYMSVDEFFESNPKFDTEDNRDIIERENRTMNFYKEKSTANGLYCFDTTINMNVFGKINLSSFIRTNKDVEKEIEDMISNQGFKIQNINGVDYLVPPMETIIEMWDALVESLYEWDFKSNNSTHGSVNQLFRSTFSLNNPMGNCMSTYGEFVYDGKAKLVINDDIDGVKTYNSVLLSQYINTKEEGIETSTMAILNAMKELKEMGGECIKVAYCE